MDKSKLVNLFLSIVLCITTLSGCYDNNEIENFAYVIAIGVDEADLNSFNLTLQTAVPKSISGGGEGGGGGGKSTDIISFKTDNFLSGLKKASQYRSMQINLSHTEIIVVSENIAKRGIIPFLNGLQQNMDIRPNVRIIVTAGEAKEYIESVQPKLLSNPSKYYELLFKSYETDFLVPYTQLEDYLYRAKNYPAQPIAIYTQVDKAINDKKPSKDDEGKKSDDGESEKSSDKMTIKGLAVFQMDKMVGTLIPEEATIYTLLTGKNSNLQIEVTDPLDNRFKVLGTVIKENSSTTEVKIKNGKPKISLNLKLNVDVQAVQSDNNYNESDKAEKLKKAYEEYLNKGLKELLSKVTYEYKSDIFGFGQFAKLNFKTINEWEMAKWHEIFPQSEYEYKIELKIKRS